MINDHYAKLELSKYLSKNELNRLERTKNFFDINSDNEIETICNNLGIPLEYIELIREGTIIAEKKILTLLKV